MPKKIAFKAARDLRTHVVLYFAADDLIKKTERIEKGGYYTTMGALVLTAFTFEAYLNHLGEAEIEFWPEVDSARVMAKYSILCDRLKVSTDFSCRPDQTIKQLFRFRNALAHGKSRQLTMSGTMDGDDETQEPPLLAEWEKYCTLKNAKRAKEDVLKAINALHTAAGRRDSPFVHGLKSTVKTLLADTGGAGG